MKKRFKHKLLAKKTTSTTFSLIWQGGIKR